MATRKEVSGFLCEFYVRSYKSGAFFMYIRFP